MDGNKNVRGVVRTDGLIVCESKQSDDIRNILFTYKRQFCI